jgi:hypothetical protein
MLPDAEIIRIIQEVFTALGWAGSYTIKLNHRKILDGRQLPDVPLPLNYLVWGIGRQFPSICSYVRLKYDSAPL